MDAWSYYQRRLVTSLASRAAPGTYMILLKLSSRVRAQIGRNRELSFSPGLYCYVGSALGHHARHECRWASWLSRDAAFCVDGFGASDCECSGHLFCLGRSPDLGSFLEQARSDLHAHHVTREQLMDLAARRPAEAEPNSNRHSDKP